MVNAELEDLGREERKEIIQTQNNVKLLLIGCNDHVLQKAKSKSLIYTNNRILVLIKYVNK